MSLPREPSQQVHEIQGRKKKVAQIKINQKQHKLLSREGAQKYDSYHIP